MQISILEFSVWVYVFYLFFKYTKQKYVMNPSAIIEKITTMSSILNQINIMDNLQWNLKVKKKILKLPTSRLMRENKQVFFFETRFSKYNNYVLDCSV